MDIRQINDAAIRMAGPDQGMECYSVLCETVSVYVDDSKVSLVEHKTEKGLAIQVLQGARLCAASSTVNEERDIRRCVDRAMAATKLAPDDPRVRGFVPPRSPSLPELNVNDRRIHGMEAGELASLAMQIVEGCDAKVPRGLLRASRIETAVSNTMGADVWSESTAVYAHFTSMLDDPSPGEGTESYHGTHLDFDPSRLGGSLRAKARHSAQARNQKGRLQGLVIIPPSELGDMLLSSAGSALNGENVVNGRSHWRGSLGQDVASPEVTLVDDPRIPGPLCSRFDDEGTPAKAKTLVQAGVLQSFLYDNYNGDSTGNGMRRSASDAQGSYNHAVSIKAMNLCLLPGRGGVEDLISQTDQGILVEKFAWPEADPFTGRFALEVRCGLVIRKGEVVGSVKNALLTGNMFDALKQVESIGADTVCTGNVSIPTVSFRGMELVGN